MRPLPRDGPPYSFMTDDKPKTLVDLLASIAERRPDDEVIRFREGNAWTGITGRDLRARVRDTALGLHECGVRKGDLVAILAESGPLWTIADFAILSLGAATVPIYPTQSIGQVEYILAESAPRLLLISNKKQFQRIAKAAERFPRLEIIALKSGSGTQRDISAIEQLGRQSREKHAGLLDSIASGIATGDLASLIYTSGTTGEPKGAMLTHGNIVFNTLASGTLLDIEPDNVMLSFLPLSHIFERMVVYLCLYFGVQVNYAAGIETVQSDILTVRPTLMSTVPRLLEKIYSKIQKDAARASLPRRLLFRFCLGVARDRARLNQEGRRGNPLFRARAALADRLVFSRFRAAFGGRLKRMVSGGAALPAGLARVFVGAGVPVLQGYGMTETSPVIAVNTLERSRIGTVGRALPGIEVRIAGDGEILTRGPHVFSGYFKRPDLTSEAFVDGRTGPEAWFKTGDIGHLDPDGYLTITDRKKDLIKTSGGKFIAPQAIENRLSQSEYVEQSVVLGEGRKYVSALIVPDFERLKTWAEKQGCRNIDRAALADEAKVKALIKSEVNRLTSDLADYERVKRIAVIPSEFTIEGGELTPTLKLRRKAILEKYQGAIEGLYAPDGEQE